MTQRVSLKSLIWGLAIAATATTAALTTAVAGSIERLDRLPGTATTKTKLVVVDLRTEKTCERASLPGARCLPASSLFDKQNRPVSFYALRWLLGTIDLTGRESVVLYTDAKKANRNTLWAAAGLLYLAGQKNVAVLDVPPGKAQLTAQGQSRGFSREAVYTAPMRDALIRLKNSGIRLENSRASLGVQLAAFARTGGTGAITIARLN